MKNISYALKSHRKKCKEKPWFKQLHAIRNRLYNKNSKYAKKGIKNYLTLDDLEFLWNKDKAWLLNRPSIDRIDNDGHYTRENCKYIELSENIRKGNFGIKKSKEHKAKIIKNLWWYKGGNNA